MAKKPSQKQAQKALDKHLSTVNEITEAEKDQLKVVQDLAKAMGESVKDTQALLKIKEKTRSLEQQLLDTIDDYNLTQDESVKIAQKALDMKQKEIARQKELNATFDKFREGWDDFWAIAQDPKVATGLFLAAAADKAKEMAESLIEAQKAMGLSYTQAIKMSGSIASASIHGLLLGISFKEMADAAGSLSNEFGDLGEVTSAAMVSVAELGHKYGLASSEAASLYKQIKLMSGGTDDMVESQIEHAENLARANNVAPGKVLKEMAGSSEFMAKFMGKNSLSMAETAVQAAKLGIEMSDISAMMDSILDIEGSIEKEMQVSVLLGRQISFDRARQLAMAGDTLGATKAILKQVGGIAEFEAMSVIQRKALAEAAGIDLATMQSMIGNREKQIEMGLIEASTYEETLGYIKGIGETVSNNLGIVTTGLNMAASMAQIKGSEFAKDVAHWVKQKAHWAADLAHRMKVKLLGGGETGSGKPSVKTPKIGGDGGGAPGESMMKGMGKIKVGSVLKGAAAMVLVAAAVFVFAKAMQEFMKVSWEAVGMAVVSMLALIGAVFLLGTLIGGPQAAFLLVGAAAMVVVAASIWVLGKAIQEMATGFDMMSGMTEQLTGLVALAPMMLLAAAGFVAMGYGLIALSAGLLLLAPMLPIILALGGLAAVGMNLMGGGEGGGDDSSNVIAEKLDILIDMMSQPGVVKMDGHKVGEVIALARGPMGT
tara:strand:+ start:2021 stop:4162 length:2142 start_codon:yes stop_codon:yes gene_type:complete